MAEGFSDEDEKRLQDEIKAHSFHLPTEDRTQCDRCLMIRAIIADRKRLKELEQDVDTLNIGFENAVKNSAEVVERFALKIADQTATIEGLKLEVGDFDRTLEVQHSRCKKAEDLWRTAHNKPHTIPDLGDLIEWLLAEAEIKSSLLEGVATLAEVYEQLQDAKATGERLREKLKDIEENPLLRIDPDGSVHQIQCENCADQAAEIERLRDDKNERDALLNVIMLMDIDVQIKKTIEGFYERQRQALDAGKEK